MSTNRTETEELGLEVAKALMSQLTIPLNQTLTDEQMLSVLDSLRMSMAVCFTIGFLRGQTDSLNRTVGQLNGDTPDGKKV